MNIENLDEMAGLLKVMGHSVRLRIVTALAGGEYSVGELEKQSGTSQPALSQQLAILRKSDLVCTRRAAKQIYYSLNQTRIAEICHAMGGMHNCGSEPNGEEARLERRRKLGSGASFARIL
ncbi:MAG: metalloregulator ArsR/SmtB family transcription factor [Sphingorhabdus sp.]